MKTTVLIAGAGPCGAALAWYLATTGIDTLLVEAMDKGRTRHEFVADVPEFLLKQPVMSGLPPACISTLANFILARGPAMDIKHAIRLPRPDYVPLYLDKVVGFLRLKATIDGARVLYKTRLEGLERRHTGMYATVNQQGRRQGIEAEMVVDCTGGRSWFARGLGLPVEAGDEVVAYRGIYGYETHRVMDAIGQTLFPYGNNMLTGFAAAYSTYNIFWDPKEHTIDVLVGGRSDRTAPLDVIQSVKHALGLSPQVHGSGGVIMLRRPHFDAVLDGFMVLGEAAGHINSAHGSGVAAGIMAAQSAADVIRHSLQHGGPTRSNLKSFGPLFFSRGGNVLAYYYQVYRFVSTLTGTQIHDLFIHGAINENTVKAAFEQRIPRVESLRSMLASMRILARPGLALTAAAAIRRAIKASKQCC